MLQMDPIPYSFSIVDKTKFIKQTLFKYYVQDAVTFLNLFLERHDNQFIFDL